MGFLFAPAPLPAPTGDHPNEPVGFVQRTEHQFVEKFPSGWGGDDDASLTIETDNDAPVGDGQVGQVLYEVGDPAGSSPGKITYFNSPGGTQEWYFHTAFKPQSNWDGHSSSANKLYLTGFDPGANNEVVWEMIGSGAGDLEMKILLQGVEDARGEFGRNVGSPGDDLITRGAWHEIETHLVMNSAGVADGEIHLWMNSVKILQYTDVEFSPDGADWEEFYWNPIWGGVGGTISEDQYIRTDWMYLSVPGS